MRVRVCVLVILACMSCLPATAQEVASKTDPSKIKACPGEPPKEGTIWHADHVGVSRLIPEMPGSNSLQVFRFYTGPEKTDIITDEVRRSLTMARMGLRISNAYLFFNAKDTPIEKAKQDPPDEFWEKMVDAARPEVLRQEVLPCGTVLQAGLTYGTRIARINGEDRLVVSALPGPTVVWWYEEGVKTPDGQPGVKVSITAPVVITDKGSQYFGSAVENIVFDICGNVSGRMSVASTTDVVALSPPLPARPEKPAIVIPPPSKLPKIQPPSKPVVKNDDKGGRFWCFKNPLTAAVCASPALLLLRGGGAKPAPNDNHTPGKDAR